MEKKPLETFAHHLFHSAPHAEIEHLSDQQLLQRYTEQQDDAAFGEIVRRHGVMVWTVCQRILKQRQDAEDVYQVTFLKLIRQAAFVRQCESVEAWLHTAARNAAISAKRTRDRAHAREKKSAAMHETSYVDTWNKRDLAALVDEEVSYLPDKLKQPIILCYVEELTHEEAARRINISTYSLRRRLTEGRQRLQQRLHKRPESGAEGKSDG